MKYSRQVIFSFFKRYTAAITLIISSRFAAKAKAACI
jgi:hypothetical protein